MKLYEMVGRTHGTVRKQFVGSCRVLFVCLGWRSDDTFVAGDTKMCMLAAQ